jgi:hypothetical protein
LLLLGLGTTANAQQLSINNNQVTVSNGGVALAGSPLTIDNAGKLTDLTGVPKQSGTLTIPSFGFDFVATSATAGNYTFAGGFIIQD